MEEFQIHFSHMYVISINGEKKNYQIKFKMGEECEMGL